MDGSSGADLKAFMYNAHPEDVLESIAVMPALQAIE